MAGVTNREFWDFRVKTRAQFTKLAEQIANIDTSGGGGISELTSKMVVDALGYTPYNAANPANYITASALTPYALKTNIPSLDGYATEDFVNNKLGDYATKDYVTTKLVNYAPLTSVQGFENRIGGLESAVPQLNDRVEQLAVTKLDSSYFTMANIKSTLGISDWALAATKPSYTAAEVGALSLDGTSKMQPSKNIVWSNTEGYEDIDVFSNGFRLLGYNASKGNYGGGIHIGTRYGWQLMTKWGENPLYYRSYNSNSQIWRDWETLAFASDIPTKLSQLTDDVVAGKYLPLSGGIIRNDSNAAPLTIASSAQTYTGMSFINKNNERGYFIYAGGSDYGVTAAGWSATYTLMHSGNIGNYNAGSATKLQTARTLWGQSFDGTSDVNGHFVSTGENGGFALYSGIRYNEALSIERLSASGTWLGLGIILNLDGYVGIGTVYPSEKLEVNGNIKTNAITIGGITLSWDSVNNALVVNGNMYGTGSITAKKSA